MFYLGGVGLALFLDLLLLGKHKKSKADWILAAWLLVIAFHLFMVTLLGQKIYPQLWGLDLPLPLLHGPLLYIYTRALTGRAMKMQHWLGHLAVPIAFYLYLIPFIFLPVAQKIFVYENNGIGYEKFMLIRSFCIPASGIVYILLSLYILRQHRQAIVQQFSSVDKVNLSWLRNLIIWLAIIWMLVIFGNDDWIFSATVVFIFFIGFFGIRQGVIFSRPMETSAAAEAQSLAEDAPARSNSSAEAVKYVKSGLSAEASQALHARLNILMATEKVYRDPDCSLMDLAAKLNVPHNHVSQVINEREGKSFYDYINSIRIQEFIEIARLPESRKLTLFALAQQCGFNSKSSFNRYFKKITSKSPSEYMQVPIASEN